MITNRDKFVEVYGTIPKDGVIPSDWWDKPFIKWACTAKTIGQRIGLALSDANMTQKELAGEIGTTSATISRWVKGQRTPDANDIRDLSTALNCSPDYLLSLEG